MGIYDQDLVQSFTCLGFTLKEFEVLQLFRNFIYPIPAYGSAIFEYSDPESKLTMIMPEILSSGKELSPIQFFMDLKAYIRFCNDQTKANPRALVSNTMLSEFMNRLNKTDWPRVQWSDFIGKVQNSVPNLRSNPVFCYPDHIVQKNSNLVAADVMKLFEGFKRLIEACLSCDLFLFNDGINFSPSNYSPRPNTSFSIFRDNFLSKAHYALNYVSKIAAALADIIRLLDAKTVRKKNAIQKDNLSGAVSASDFWQRVESFLSPRPKIIPYKLPVKKPVVKKHDRLSSEKDTLVVKIAHNKLKPVFSDISKFVDETIALGAAPGELTSENIIKILPVLDKAVSDQNISFSIFKRLCEVSLEEFNYFLSVITSILDYNWELASTQDKLIFTKDVKGQDKLFALKPQLVTKKFSEHFNNLFLPYLEANLGLNIGKDIESKIKVFKKINNRSFSSLSEAMEDIL